MSFVEFSYNNGYQASLKMSPFEALYGRRCQTPLMWSEVGERCLFGPDMIKKCRRTSSQSQREPKSSTKQTKELCRHPTKAIGIPTRRLCLSKIITDQGHSKIPSQRKFSTAIHWAIHWETWSYSIPPGTASRNVRCARCVSCNATKAMLEGTRRTSTYGSHGFTARPTVPRETNQDIGCCHLTNKKDNSKVLSGRMEQSYRGRRHMGKRGWS